MSQRVTGDHSRLRGACAWLLKAGALAALSSCAREEALDAPPPAPLHAAHAHKPLTTAHNTTAPLPAVTSTPNAPPPSARVVAVNVVGHSLADVERTLGQPAGRSSDGGGQTWTYCYSGKPLKLTSFYDVSSGNFVVLGEHLDEAGTCGAKGT